MGVGFTTGAMPGFIVAAAALCLATAVVKLRAAGTGAVARQRHYHRCGATTFGTERRSAVSMGNATTGSAKVARAGRSRDAAASKDALLQAARTLFGEQGLEGTTIREIGERAGVDAALIVDVLGSITGDGSD
jgi:hypothetical protein